MNRIEIKDFSIKIDKDKVLKTLGCFEGSSVYETVSSYFDELEETVMDLLQVLHYIHRHYSDENLSVKKLAEYQKAFLTTVRV